MRYAPFIKQVDSFFGNSALGHFFLFKSMDLLLPRSWHLRREISKWRNANKKNQHILDAGSGLGQNAYRLAKTDKTWSITGLDINPNYVAHCNEVFRKMHLENVFFKSCDLSCETGRGTYDLVLSMDLAEYVQDDQGMFKNFYDVLEERGVLLLYTHLIDEKNPDKKRVRMKLVDEQERNGYSSKDIKAKLFDAGFSKVKVRYVFGMLGRISWYLAVFYPLKFVNISKFFFALLPIYYLLVFPIVLVLNYIESHTGHITGSAMFVKAIK